ncbi:MAG: hypothetical protein ACXVJT_04830 [Thermoanaerobaculia bacterium]
MTRDVVWRDGVAMEDRVSFGEAKQSGRTIAARDAFDPQLDRSCAAALDALRPLAKSVRNGGVRTFASARRVTSVNGGDEWTSAAMTVTIGGRSIVTTAEHFATDVARLQSVAPPASAALVDYREWPTAWHNGSASVLLHEAVGHAAEENAAAKKWPRWLRVRDEPQFRLDDAGNVTRAADLLAEVPASFRRGTFRDVPIRRMTRVVTYQEQAPFVMPARRIDIHLLRNGHYDPLTDQVVLSVSDAQLVEGRRKERLQPFVIRASRDRIATALAGASGAPVRYPGVVCATDGQKLIVDCAAPLMLMTELQ